MRGRETKAYVRKKNPHSSQVFLPNQFYWQSPGILGWPNSSVLELHRPTGSSQPDQIYPIVPHNRMIWHLHPHIPFHRKPATIER